MAEKKPKKDAPKLPVPPENPRPESDDDGSGVEEPKGGTITSDKVPKAA